MPLSWGLAFENPACREELRHPRFWAHPKRTYRALVTVRGDEGVILVVRAPGEKPITPEVIEVQDSMRIASVFQEAGRESGAPPPGVALDAHGRSTEGPRWEAASSRLALALNLL